ncbi:MAG: tRNA (adenosine(37)-N6)-dimethylallyltransferase MiaA, partial [Desulfitobacteriaceae bacterium]|nr:tRNA (adenosine(37)-N6)-dimethylallyltransferase MiaA [Desulfitobacteriaceae bacterium]
MIEKEKVAVIVGPTAVGKTAVSIRTADILGAEIISGDSMQVYRGMDIGTAKILEEEMYAPSGKKISHHMIDIVDPDEAYSAADFQEMVRKTISALNKEGKLPLIVGGTGLYINAVLDLYNFTEMDIDEKYRQEKWEEAEKYGSHFLHKELADIDQEAAERIHPHDTKRIIRALEIYHQTKRTVSELQEGSGESNPVYQVVLVGLFMERDLLYQRINQRVDKMIDSGLIDEVKNLLEKGYYPRLNSMQGLG